MNSYVRNLMTKLDVAPCFDVVIRDKPFDLVATLEKHEDIFHRTDKFFMVVHEDGLKVPKYSRDRLLDRGCVGVVSKKGLRDLLVELKNKMHNDPKLKDMFMDPLRNTMKRDVPKMSKECTQGCEVRGDWGSKALESRGDRGHHQEAWRNSHESGVW
jgi:hypothetical protein